jgi:uncharacterized lipoprotein YajG
MNFIYNRFNMKSLLSALFITALLGGCATQETIAPTDLVASNQDNVTLEQVEVPGIEPEVQEKEEEKAKPKKRRRCSGRATTGSRLSNKC